MSEYEKALDRLSNPQMSDLRGGFVIEPTMTSTTAYKHIHELISKFDIYETALKYSNEIWRDKKLSAEDKVKAYEDILLHVNEFLYELKRSD